MARGFLSGIVLGAAVSAVGLGVASQFAPRVDLGPAEPEAAAAEPAAGAQPGAAEPGTQPEPPAGEGRPAGTEAPVAPGAGMTTGAPPVADTEPAAEPETGAVEESGLSAPETGETPEMEAGAEEAVLPAPGALQPAPPAVDLAPIAAGPGEEDAATSEEPGAADPVPEAPDAATGTAADAPPVVLPDGADPIRLPVPEIGDMAPGVTTDRLPTIGAQPEEASAEPALQTHAAPFEAPSGAPLMAVVLVDQGSARLDPAGLAGFPVPFSVAVDATAPDAEAAMAAYRAAGLEVVALTPLPAGATPADVEVAFEGYLKAVPDSVAVLDVPEALFQENRPRSAQIADILAATGHGMITYDKGVNSALQVADSAGVKAATVFRNFDNGVRDATAMKRFLDQGAFRAGQEGGMVMVGLLRAETLTALTEWALGTRAETITLAPVSAVLMQR